MHDYLKIQVTHMTHFQHFSRQIELNNKRQIHYDSIYFNQEILIKLNISKIRMIEYVRIILQM